MLRILPLSKETLQDRVYRQIASLILEGGIVPGEMVPVQSLADAFGVSAMPVREALRRLTAANALTVVSGRSIGIPRLSRAKLTDLRNVRIEIEALAGKWAAERIEDSELAKLRSLLKALEKANASGDIKSYLRANYAFHFSIYRAAGSESILNIIENLGCRSARTSTCCMIPAITPKPTSTISRCSPRYALTMARRSK